MNTNDKNPLFYVMQANPKRYVNTPSSTIVMIIRALEGVVAAVLSFKVLWYVLGLFSGSSPGVFALPGILKPGSQAAAATDILPGPVQSLLEEQLADIMPEGETIDSLLQQGLTTMTDALSENMGDAPVDTFTDPDTALRTLVTPGTLETLVTMIASIALLAILVCTVVEAVAFILLRFALKGSAASKIAHKVIFIAALVLLICSVILVAIFANKCRLLGITATLFFSQLRTTAILVGVCLVVLFLRVLYHKDVANVLAAIHYEITLDFKETDLKVKWLSTNALIFMLLAVAAAVLLAIKSGFFSIGVIIAVVLVIKYLMVYNCWVNYHQCHM